MHRPSVFELPERGRKSRRRIGAAAPFGVGTGLPAWLAVLESETLGELVGESPLLDEALSLHEVTHILREVVF